MSLVSVRCVFPLSEMISSAEVFYYRHALPKTSSSGLTGIFFSVFVSLLGNEYVQNITLKLMHLVHMLYS